MPSKYGVGRYEPSIKTVYGPTNNGQAFCSCSSYYQRDPKRLYYRERTNEDQYGKPAKYRWQPVGYLCLKCELMVLESKATRAEMDADQVLQKTRRDRSHHPQAV